MSASKRDGWCTPEPICAALGRFDVDPCSNERSTVRADVYLDGSAGRDGLSWPLRHHAGLRIYCNPPYSDVTPWVDAWCSAVLSTVWLVRLDPSVAWYRRLHAAARLLAIPPYRIGFVPPPGAVASSNPFPHVLLFTGPDNARDAQAVTELRRAGWLVAVPDDGGGEEELIGLLLAHHHAPDDDVRSVTQLRMTALAERLGAGMGDVDAGWRAACVDAMTQPRTIPVNASRAWIAGYVASDATQAAIADGYYASTNVSYVKQSCFLCQAPACVCLVSALDSPESV